MEEFDYIIVGGGASGLLLADALGSDPYFGSKRIALFEKEQDKGNDRTWCFWETGEGRFDPILTRSWDHVWFRGPDYERKLSLQPFRYKMLRGADFYREYHQRIGDYPNIATFFEEVSSIEEAGRSAIVHTAARSYRAPLVFSSVSFEPMASLMRPYPVLQQHFIGWFIRSENPVFDATAPTFMDFSIPQQGNTRFMYILPLSDREALVEYTLFSESLLKTEEYETALRVYITDTLGSTSYEVVETEKGSIPMTVNDFSAADREHLVHIGIAGSWAKPSTGYTFWNTTRNIPKLVDALKNGKPLKVAGRNKFWFYDRIFLNVLALENEKGSEVFGRMFRELSPQVIFRFLQEDTDLAEDLRVINSCPKGMFLRAFWKALTKSSY